MSANVAHLPDGADLESSASALVAIGRDFYARGWALATGGNFSMRLGSGMIITASGREKGSLTAGDMVVLDLDGRVQRGSPQTTPSAETKLHAQLYRRLPHVGAVLHMHSPCATVLSRLEAGTGVVELTGYEMLKALSDVRTHEHTERVPIFANSQNMDDLARDLDRWLDAFGAESLHGYLVAGHGLYTWGRDVREAHRHVEAFEFLFDCTLRHRTISGRNTP